MTQLLTRVTQRCSGLCFLAFGLLGIFVTIMLMSVNEGTTRRFIGTLGPDQKQAYEKIVRLRSNLFLKGLALGIVLTAVFSMVAHTLVPSNPNRLGCFALTSVLLITCIYYHTAHKPDVLANHIQTRAQMAAYLEVQKRFTRLRQIGFLLGIGLYLLFGCLY